MGVAFQKAVAHGIVRAGMAKLQGQKVSSGFWSGFVSSGFSVGTSGYGGTPGRTFIMAVVGGTTSELTGGKFANGAVTGAFVHLFNAEWRIGKWTNNKVLKVHKLSAVVLTNPQIPSFSIVIWKREVTMEQYRENYLMCENSCTQGQIKYEFREVEALQVASTIIPNMNLSSYASPKKAEYGIAIDPWEGKPYPVRYK